MPDMLVHWWVAGFQPPCTHRTSATGLVVAASTPVLISMYTHRSCNRCQNRLSRLAVLRTAYSLRNYILLMAAGGQEETYESSYALMKQAS